MTFLFGQPATIFLRLALLLSESPFKHPPFLFQTIDTMILQEEIFQIEWHTRLTQLKAELETTSNDSKKTA